MSRNQRLWCVNSAAILASFAIMSDVAISALYSFVYSGKPLAIWSGWIDYMGHAARHSADPFHYSLWRVAQCALLLSPLSLWFGWSLLGRLVGNIRTINEIKGLRRRRRDLINAENQKRADYSAAAHALESARQNYPDHISWPDLEEDERWGDDRLLADLLDPPEVIIRYSQGGYPASGELYLYDRKRVEATKASPEYLKRSAELRQRRWKDGGDERRYLAMLAREEEIASIERKKQEERDRRQASQKIVCVS